MQKKMLCYHQKYNSRSGFLKYYYLVKISKLNYRNHSFVSRKSCLGENLCFPHGLSGIYISSGATIGDRCTIFHQVTIGSNTLADSKNVGAPTIGNNVYIGTGAKIIGNVRIGDNVRIGANATVTFDVPDNSTVVPAKATVIYHENARDNQFQAFRN